MEHNFSGPSYTIGIEEELMILDGQTLELVNAIEDMLEASPAGEIKPELMESVLEISTDPCDGTGEAGEHLPALPRQGAQTPESQNLTIGSAPTPPVAMMGDPPTVPPPRH